MTMSWRGGRSGVVRRLFTIWGVASVSSTIAWVFLPAESIRSCFIQKLSSQHSQQGQSRLFVSEITSDDEYDRFASEFDQLLRTSQVEGDEKMKSNSKKRAVEFYRRDPRNTVPVDEEAVRNLLARRISARRRHDFEEVRRLDDELRKKHGVRAYDKDRIWTTEKTPPLSFLRRKARKASNAMKKQYGPTGHAYVQVGSEIDPSVCPLSPREIHSLLSRRLQCRMEGRFETADAIRFELQINGVRWSDGLGQWRADGRNTFEKCLTESVAEPLMADSYTQHEMSANLLIRSVRTRVESLMQARAEARMLKDFHLVDSLTLELYRTYNVVVDDIDCTWSVGGTCGPNISAMGPSRPSVSSTTPLLPILFAGIGKDLTSPPYQQSNFSQIVPDELVLSRIQTLVQERLHTREERSFHESNAIQKELWETYGVGVNDRLRQWSAGGSFELPSARSQVSNAPPELDLLYSRSPGSDALPPETLKDVENLIRYLQDVEKSGNQNAADRILDRLRDMYGVVLSNETMEWAIASSSTAATDNNEAMLSGLYQPRGPLGGMSQKQLENIQALVNRRYEEKYKKDNALIADTIRDGLLKKHRVVINDDDQVWYVDPPPEGGSQN